MSKSLFPSIGNLAYYHGWSPNYFYFNSLLNIKNISGNSKTGFGSPTTASIIASGAVDDALAHSNFNNLSEEDASTQMLVRFQNIITFLRAAYNMELANEQAYFKRKYAELKAKFPGEAEAIAPLVELLDMFKDYNANGFDYPRFISLINVLLMGLNDTKTIAAREEERIQSINDEVNTLLIGRAHQASKVGEKKGKNGLERIGMMRRAINKLDTQIHVEYLEHGNLTSGQWSGGKFKYNLWGGKKLDTRIKNTVDVEIAHWVTDTTQIVVNNPKFLQALAAYLQSAYPKATDFSQLEPKIKGLVILAIQEYGLRNLSKILAAKVNKTATKGIVDDIVDNNDIFQATASYNIQGLYSNYGQIGRQSALMKTVTDIDDVADADATRLFDTISKLIAQMKTKLKLTDQQNLLLEVFGKGVNGEPDTEEWRQLRELDTLITQLKRIDAELRKHQDQLDQGLIDIDSIAEEDGLYLDKGADGGVVRVTFTIVDGQVQVDGQLNELVSQTRSFQNLEIKKLNTTQISGITGVLKRKASAKLKQTLRANLHRALEADIEKRFRDETDLLAQIQQGLENMQISIGGPKLSELTSAIEFRQSGGDLIVDWVGGANGKNDVITITINTDNVARNLNLNLDQIVMDTVEMNFEPHLLEARNAFITEWHKAIESSIKQYATSSDKKRYRKIAQEFLAMSRKRSERSAKINAAYDELKTAWYNYKQFLEKQGADAEKLAQMEKAFLDSLSDSFYVSTTVKTYNTYLNDTGFIGGSLGGDLDTQLARIADLFSLAGMPIKDDLKWLRSAILNCSPLSVVGEKNKNLIEDYLGSVAALALFDEGGAEAKIVSAMLKQTQDSVKKISTTANILHLYRTNTLYVPGSYVLQQIILHLEGEVIPNIEKIPSVMKRGAGVTIINKASESMIGNRPIHATTNPKRSVWTLTGQAVADSIDIKILFLAGLLDIAKGINETLGNIELPG